MANAEQQLHLAQTGTTLRSCSNAMHSSLLRLLALLAALATLSACASTPQPASPPQPKPKTYFSLGLNGYNYTDHYIDSFEVNGTGGGNLTIAKRGDIGGGVCCTGWRVGEPLPKKYTIRWTAQSCRYVEVSGYDGSRSNRVRALWKEQDVWLKASDLHIDADSTPSSFETHFYPDGHVELAIVSHASQPRLLRPIDPATGRRPGVPYWPDWCTAEQATQPGYPLLWDWIVLPDGHIENDPVFHHQKKAD